MLRTYAIGDVHGCLDKLQRLVQLCERDSVDQKIKFVFLGDYVDRGFESRLVIEFLINLQTRSSDEIICLMGNHESMLLSAFDDENMEEHWLKNGGTETLYSYHASSAVEIPKKHIEWIRSLPKYHDDGLRFFVHAGVRTDRSLHQQRERDLLWIREPFLSSTYNWDRLLIHGHSPTENGVPDQRSNRLNIDTGAVFGGPLTAAVFSSDTRTPTNFIFSE